MTYYKIGMISCLAILLLLVSACGNNEEENNNNINNENDNEVVSTETETEFEYQDLDKTELGDNIVATYEGGEITGDEFATYLSVQAVLNPDAPLNDNEFRIEILKDLIMNKITGELPHDAQWAQEQADLTWGQIKMQYGEEMIQEGYDTFNVTEVDMKNFLLQAFKSESAFRNQVSEEEKTALYDEFLEELTTATFTHILISTEEKTDDEALSEANELYEQLEADADINTLASEHSDDEGSVESGGRYEQMMIMELDQDFKNAILEQDIDVVGKPVKTGFGYHIIRVEELEVVPFEEVEDGLVYNLIREKYNEYFTETLPSLINNIDI